MANLKDLRLFNNQIGDAGLIALASACASAIWFWNFWNRVSVWSFASAPVPRKTLKSTLLR